MKTNKQFYALCAMALVALTAANGATAATAPYQSLKRWLGYGAPAGWTAAEQNMFAAEQDRLGKLKLDDLDELAKQAEINELKRENKKAENQMKSVLSEVDEIARIMEKNINMLQQANKKLEAIEAASIGMEGKASRFKYDASRLR